MCFGITIIHGLRGLFFLILLLNRLDADLDEQIILFILFYIFHIL